MVAEFAPPKIGFHKGDALLIVDVQNDFLPGGALAVPLGDDVIVPLNQCIDLFIARKLPIFATRDWHPPDHCSFREQGGPWPSHCVAGSAGAAFPARLRLPEKARVIDKGYRAEREAYSGFAGTDLTYLLRGYGITRLLIGGLATDYCVLNTVRDAIAADFSVVLLRDAIRAVDLTPGDGARALDAMLQLGVTLISLTEIG